ncbi:MAG TPA: hypothetical protein VKU01_20675 [Bryobacteraceae bacterium]|nr:hypothetical protein [Bryobacteraceae bacterium]
MQHDCSISSFAKSLHEISLVANRGLIVPVANPDTLFVILKRVIVVVEQYPDLAMLANNDPVMPFRRACIAYGLRQSLNESGSDP